MTRPRTHEAQRALHDLPHTFGFRLARRLCQAIIENQAQDLRLLPSEGQPAKEELAQVGDGIVARRGGRSRHAGRMAVGPRRSDGSRPTVDWGAVPQPAQRFPTRARGRPPATTDSGAARGLLLPEACRTQTSNAGPPTGCASTVPARQLACICAPPELPCGIARNSTPQDHQRQRRRQLSPRCTCKPPRNRCYQVCAPTASTAPAARCRSTVAASGTVRSICDRGAAPLRGEGAHRGRRQSAVGARVRAHGGGRACVHRSAPGAFSAVRVRAPARADGRTGSGVLLPRHVDRRSAAGSGESRLARTVQWRAGSVQGRHPLPRIGEPRHPQGPGLRADFQECPHRLAVGQREGWSGLSRARSHAAGGNALFAELHDGAVSPHRVRCGRARRGHRRGNAGNWLSLWPVPALDPRVQRGVDGQGSRLGRVPTAARSHRFRRGLLRGGDAARVRRKSGRQDRHRQRFRQRGMGRGQEGGGARRQDR